MKHPFRRGLALLSAVVLGVGAAVMPLGSAKPLEADAATADVVKIACIGASTTLGAGGNGTSWPSELGKLLGGLCEVKNYGENSRTVLHDGVEWDDTARKNNLAYTRTPQYKESLAYKADIVLIMLGGNDAKPINWRDGNNTFEEDYKALVEAYQKANENTKVIVVIEPWIRNDGAFTITEPIMESGVRPAYTKVAQEMGLDTIDLYTPTKGHNEWYSDNVHANAAGYAAMAKVIAERMREMNLIPEGSEKVPPRPALAGGVEFGAEYDGYEVIQWKGKSGSVAFTSGMLADRMGLDKKTTVKNLTINVSYYWDATAAGNDWWHFNTTDKTGQSAPNVDGSNPHDNGFGTFAQYGMKMRQWDVLTVSRDDQSLRGSGNDWNMSVGDIAGNHALYIRGYQVIATLSDGSIKTATWGVMQDSIVPADGKKFRIACVGASTTRGNNVPSDNGTCYGDFLKELIGKDNCTIGNFGLPGGTATKRTDGFNDLIYIGSGNHKNSLKFKPDIVIIDLGVNDSQTSVWNTGTFAQDYEELVKSYLDLDNHPLVLISLGGHCTKNTWDTTDSRIARNVMPAQMAVAQKYNLPIANMRDVLTSDPDKYVCAEDGVHYTEEGHKAMAQCFYDAIVPLMVTPADKTALKAAIAEEVDLTGYTKETADAYTKALKAAKAVDEDARATQEEVDAATTALTDAKAALVKAVDKTELQEALADEVEDLSIYTPESVAEYNRMRQAALDVMADENATQFDVHAAAVDLIKAKVMLQLQQLPQLLGDVNGDDKVDSGDALQLLRYAAEIITDKDLDLSVADLNGDGKVDSGDALLSLQYAAEIITEFPAEK